MGLQDTVIIGKAFSGNAETNPPPYGGSNIPTSEHVNFAAGVAVADPSKDVTWVDGGGSHGNITLADGTRDGQQKIIITTFLSDGALTITPASGQQYSVGVGTAAAYTARWDGVHNAWTLIAGVNIS